MTTPTGETDRSRDASTDRLVQVRSLLLAELRRLTADDVSSGGRRWRDGVRTARAASAARLTYIIEALDG